MDEDHKHPAALRGPTPAREMAVVILIALLFGGGVFCLFAPAGKGLWLPAGLGFLVAGWIIVCYRPSQMDK
jgi:uncharacterized membrane protein YccC